MGTNKPTAHTSVPSVLTLRFSSQAQTPQQRRANAKFFKEQEANRGKSREEIKKKTKEAFKSPISPLWLGMYFPSAPRTHAHATERVCDVSFSD